MTEQAIPERRQLEEAVAAVRAALRAGDLHAVTTVLEGLRPADRVDVVEALGLKEQALLLERIADPSAADILEELEDVDAAVVAEALDPAYLAPIIDQMELDEAADVLGDLSPDQVANTLAAMDDAVEAEVRPLLEYTDESAGGLMTPAFVALRSDETAQQSIERLRNLSPDAEAAYYLYTVDRGGRLVGVVSLRQLVVAEPERPLTELMSSDVIQANTRDDQEDAARLMARYDLLALPVVDERGRLAGVITHDDLVDVLEAEATEDMYRMVGMEEPERTADPLWVSVRSRLPWLALNLGLQMALVWALKLFEPTIERVAVLAVLYPLVTGQGGNVGSQTMTIVVRSMALGEFDRTNRRRLLAKQVATGLLIGVVIGLMAGLVALAVVGDRTLAAQVATVMVLAMTLNLAAGGLVGVLVPVTLKQLGLDPALASSVFVTTSTDTLGVLIFFSLFRFVVG